MCVSASVLCKSDWQDKPETNTNSGLWGEGGSGMEGAGMAVRHIQYDFMELGTGTRSTFLSSQDKF